MACRLFGAKTLPEPTLTYHQWKEHTSVKFESKYKNFIHGNVFENVFFEKATILSRGRGVDAKTFMINRLASWWIIYSGISIQICYMISADLVSHLDIEVTSHMRHSDVIKRKPFRVTVPLWVE